MDGKTVSVCATKKADARELCYARLLPPLVLERFKQQQRREKQKGPDGQMPAFQVMEDEVRV